jgi:hypothetical protein
MHNHSLERIGEEMVPMERMLPVEIKLLSQLNVLFLASRSALR